jgi:hypothetical protein
MTASGLRRQAGVALWVAACVAGGCAVERVTAVDLVDSGTDDGAIASGGDASTDGTGYGETSASSSGGESGVSMLECADAGAASTTSDLEGQFPWPDSGYFFRNDAWNVDAGPGPQTLSACSYSSWNVVANEPSTTTVKSYPDVQMDFQASAAGNGTGVPINTYKSITSTFAEVGPSVGLYEYAYDIFVNSDTIIGPGTTEIMIWVDVFGNRVPAATKVETAVSLDGRPYDVYETDNSNGGHYIVFVADQNFSSGSVNVFQFFDYVIGQGWIPFNAPLNQICFGVEICETGGSQATFQFTNFSITATPN